MKSQRKYSIKTCVSRQVDRITVSAMHRADHGISMQSATPLPQYSTQQLYTPELSHLGHLCPTSDGQNLFCFDLIPPSDNHFGVISGFGCKATTLVFWVSGGPRITSQCSCNSYPLTHAKCVTAFVIYPMWISIRCYGYSSKPKMGILLEEMSPSICTVVN